MDPPRFEEASCLCRHELPTTQEKLGYDLPAMLGATWRVINALVEQGNMHEIRELLQISLAIVRGQKEICSQSSIWKQSLTASASLDVDT